uniref:Uncharacterized protein n=1 Tax=viral metagenome TaxID=1070528 RepID=A0A6C0CL21_9ZZZZ
MDMYIINFIVSTLKYLLVLLLYTLTSMRKLKGVKISDNILNLDISHIDFLIIWDCGLKVTNIKDDDEYIDIDTLNTLLPLSDLHLVHIAKYFDTNSIYKFGGDVYFSRD